MALKNVILRWHRPILNHYICCMKTMIRNVVSFLATLMLSACDIIDYHPYDARLDGTHDINARNMTRIEQACAGKKALKFVLISDTQRWYDETYEAVKSINARTDIDFVVHCGDLSDFGVTKEFEQQRDILVHIIYQ